MDQPAWGSWKRNLGEYCSVKNWHLDRKETPVNNKLGDKLTNELIIDALLTIIETAFRTSKTASPTSKTEQLTVIVTPPPPRIIELQKCLALIDKTKWNSGSSRENTSRLARGIKNIRMHIKVFMNLLVICE